MNGNDWREWRPVRLRALADAPEAFCSKLADWQGVGDTEMRWRDRLDGVPYNLVAEIGGRAAGMVSVTAPTERGTVELISMWVAPEARGSGVADALVEACAQRARELRCRLELRVIAANARAIAFYRRAGFVDAGEAIDTESGEPERWMHYER